MEHYEPSLFYGQAEPVLPLGLATADYARLLHPEGSRGKASVMIIDDGGRGSSRAVRPEELPVVADAVVDATAFLSLNRFFGPRQTDKLAALNAIYLDLDYYALARFAHADAALVGVELEMDFTARGIPGPSLLVSTGRGLAATWLIDELPPAALPRWKGCLKALIDLYRPFGADLACSDALRVFRLPGTVNPKVGRRVRVIGGSHLRHDFDRLADVVYAASGRPTRRQLEGRRARKKERATGEAGETPTPRGLPPAARFRQVERDLQRLRAAWGGTVPEGHRNSWLHVYATCLTHVAEPAEIEDLVLAMAAEATPGLPAGEVRALIGSALRRAEQARGAAPQGDGRLHYAGATLADMLGVTDRAARTLGLEQVFSKDERKRRKAEREKARRAAAGAQDRAAWLAVNSRSRDKPWEALKIHRSTWYRLSPEQQAMREAALKAVETPPEA